MKKNKILFAIFISLLFPLTLLNITCSDGKKDFYDLKSEIKEMVKFSTQEAMFKEIYYNDNGMWLFLKKEVLVSCNIKFKAGFVLDENFDLIKENNDKVKVKMPRAEILSADLVEESCYNYRDDQGLNEKTLNDLSTQESKEKMVEDLIKMGFLDRAEEKMKLFLTGILNSAGYSDIEFEFIEKSNG